MLRKDLSGKVGFKNIKIHQVNSNLHARNGIDLCVLSPQNNYGFSYFTDTYTGCTFGDLWRPH